MSSLNQKEHFDPTLLEQHYSTRVFRGYLKYLEKKFSLEKAKEIISKTGLTWEFLNNETNWVSEEYSNRFNDVLLKEQGIDDDFPFQAGKISMSRELLGPVQ